MIGNDESRPATCDPTAPATPVITTTGTTAHAARNARSYRGCVAFGCVPRSGFGSSTTPAAHDPQASNAATAGPTSTGSIAASTTKNAVHPAAIASGQR